MKKLFISSILVFAFALFAFAQETPKCAEVSVSSPSGIESIGNPLTFTANVRGVSLENIGYKWTVSKGDIVEGQGTPILKVKDESVGSATTATVEITGLPDNCPKSASAIYDIADGCGGLPLATKFDEFSVIPPRLRKERLDALFVQMNNDPNSQIYIVERFKNNTSRTAIEKKFSNLKSWLQIKKIDTSRISFYIGDNDDNLTEFWIRPPGALLPTFENAVEISLWNYQKELAKLFANKQKTSLKKQTSRKPVRKN